MEGAESGDLPPGGWWVSLDSATSEAPVSVCCSQVGQRQQYLGQSSKWDHLNPGLIHPSTMCFKQLLYVFSVTLFRVKSHLFKENSSSSELLPEMREEVDSYIPYMFAKSLQSCLTV